MARYYGVPLRNGLKIGLGSVIALGKASTPPIFPVTASYLVVAGGGGGGYAALAGGGAGGVLTSPSVTLSSGITYTATVGSGGAGNNYGASIQCTNGGNSSISGAGFSTVTAIGGGRSGTTIPGTQILIPNSGGSGGGGTPTNSGSLGAVETGGAGTAGQGNKGGDASYSFPNIGGGGAGEAIPGGNGTANTGGGGGGGAYACGGPGYNGGAGGSGVIIISCSSSLPIATTTGSPVVSVSGSNRIYQFNGSGTIRW